MASAFSGQVSAAQVGSFFLGQYYHRLQKSPNSVHQFYANTSTMIRYDGDTNEMASGMAEIHNLIVRLNFTEIEIITAHSLESWDGGVLVTVTGFVQAKDFIFRRKFVETFFLAPQEKGYFVLNDIFLILEEEQVHQHPAAMLTPTDYDTKLDALNYDTKIDTLNPLQDPVSSHVLGEDISTGDFISPPIYADENNQLDNYSVPGEPNLTPDPDETIDETPVEFTGGSVLGVQNIVQDRPVTEEPCGERPKHTYASILRTAKAQVAPQLTSVNKTAPVLPEWHLAHQANQQQVQATISSLPEKCSADLSDEAFAFEDEGESKSVYVGNLPASISTSDLEQEFRNFGRIKPDGVTIRSRKEAGVFYAFIEFEDAVGVQNALKATPVQLNGRMIHVEGRRPNSGASRGGRRGRGRGGYYSEAPRGRFGGRSFPGRGGGSLDNDRDYSSRPRGNGYIQRLPRQERGILGSHFPKNGESQPEPSASWDLLSG